MANSLHLNEARTGVESATRASMDSRETLPVVLTAQALLRSRPDLAAALRGARLDVRAVASWDRLPEGIERIAAAVVLVDMDAADRGGKGRSGLSGHRIVTLLARQLAGRGIALVVLTGLDFAEVEDLARAGVSALVAPDTTTKALVALIRSTITRREQRPASHAATAVAGNTPAPGTRQGRSGPASRSGRRNTTPPRAHSDDDWRLPDALWRELARALPGERRPARTRISDRQVLEAMFYLLRTGAPWSSLPRSFGSAQTIRRRLRAWNEAGVLERLESQAMRERSYLRLLDWGRLTRARALAAPVGAGSSARYR